MISCTFTGHRKIFSDCSENIDRILECLLAEYGSLKCYVGEDGDFDSLCAARVKRLKENHPENSIRLILALPYMRERINRNRGFYTSFYDEIVVPHEAYGAYSKGAFSLCNRWKVDRSDFVISFVTKSFGGAFETVKYAEKKGKKVINLGKIPL